MNTPTSMRTYTPRRSRRWPIVALAAVALVCAIVAVVALTKRPTGPDTASTTGSSPTSAAVPGSATGGDLIRPGSGTASACLGGGEVDISMLLRAQKAAELTPQGAAGFAASFTRWARWPSPSAQEFDIAEEKVWASAPAESIANLRGLYREYVTDLSFEQTEYVTDGKYLVEEVTENEAVVSLLYRRLTDPPDAANVRGTTTVVLEATPSGWRVVDIGSPRQDPDSMWEKGTPFDTSKCGVNT